VIKIDFAIVVGILFFYDSKFRLFNRRVTDTKVGNDETFLRPA